MSRRKSDNLFPSFQEAKPPAKKRVKITGGEVENFYAIMNQEKKYQTAECHYPNEEVIQMKVPMMATIAGKTGSMKTNAMMDILKKINIWEKIYLCVRDPEEPLYRWFTDKVREVEKETGASIIKVIDDVAKLPDVDDFMKGRDPKNPRQMCFIFDDVITEKDKLLNRITKYYIKGRKVFASCFFLSQSYYKTPKDVRKNCGYIILKHIAQDSDLKRIISDYEGVGVSFEKLCELYHMAIDSGPQNFFMIDLNTKDDNLKFRINYTGIPASEWKTEDTSHSTTDDETQ